MASSAQCIHVDWARVQRRVAFFIGNNSAMVSVKVKFRARVRVELELTSEKPAVTLQVLACLFSTQIPPQGPVELSTLGGLVIEPVFPRIELPPCLRTSAWHPIHTWELTVPHIASRLPGFRILVVDLRSANPHSLMLVPSVSLASGTGIRESCV